MSAQMSERPSSRTQVLEAIYSLYESEVDVTAEALVRYTGLKTVTVNDCIKEDHMVRKTRSQLLRGIPKQLPAKLAIQAAMKRRWGKSPDAVEIIRASEKTNTELAKELDMTPSNVWAIRAGRTHKLQQSPFAGLGAR